jgi:hypothetical protein
MVNINHAKAFYDLTLKQKKRGTFVPLNLLIDFVV